IWSGAANLSGVTKATAVVFRVLAGAADMTAEGELDAKIQRVIRYHTQLSASSNLRAVAGKYMIRKLVYSGAFAPGDEILITTQYRRLTKNGADARHLMSGDWILIMPSENEIQYRDTEAQ